MANDYVPSWQRKLQPEPEPPQPDPLVEYMKLLLQSFDGLSDRLDTVIELQQAIQPEPALPPDLTPIASEVAKLREILLRTGSQSPPSDLGEVVRLLGELRDQGRDEGRWNALGETLRKASQDGARAVVSTGASGNAQNVGIKDSASNRIDPATEQKQDSALTELQSLVAKDFATQATLADVLTRLTTLRDTVYRRTDALPAGTNAIGSTIPNRPSQGPGRTAVHGHLVSGTGNRTAYTVTGGKTLYVTSITVSAYNSSSTAGDLRIRDSSTERVPLAIPQAGSGILASQVGFSAVNLQFLEPKVFSTDVSVAVISGTITYTVAFSGYEE